MVEEMMAPSKSRVDIRKMPVAIWLCLVGFFALGTLYATVTPVFEKPDENWHFAFSMYLAETGRLPVQSLEERDHLAEQEGSQPPLYYAALAALMRLTGMTGLEAGYHELTEVNPYYGVRDAAWLDNANQFVHDDCVGSCRATLDAVYLGRFLSLFFGLLALAGGAAATLLAFPERPWLALAVTGTMAFNPQFLHISSSVSNDAATVAMINLGFAFALWWWRRPDSVWRVALLGTAVGLAVLGKPSGLSAGVTFGLLLLLAGTVPPRTRARQIAIFGAVIAAISGWWFLRNLLLYGEPTATSIHLEVYGVSGAPLTVQRLADEWIRVANTFWASFGWGGINLGHDIYQMANLAALALVVAFVIFLARQWRQLPRGQRLLIALAAVQLLVVAGLLAQWMRLTEAPLGRLLFPALFPVALILVLGLFSLVPRRLERPVASVLVITLAGVALALALLLIRPAYQPPAVLETLPADATPLGVMFGDQIVLEGYDAPAEPVPPGSPVTIRLYWRALRPIDEQFSVGLKVFGRDEQLLAEDNSLPAGGRAPTTGWPAGEIVEDRRSFRLSDDADVPTLGRVEIDLFRHLDPALSWLPATIEGQVARPFRPFSLLVREEIAPAPTLSFSVRPVVENVSLDEMQVQVNFVWEVGRSLEGDLKAFLHLVPAPDQPPVHTGDFDPQGGTFPTSAWWPGDRLPESARLDLPDNLPEGQYWILVGLYDLATGERVVGEDSRSAWELARLSWDGSDWRLDP